MKIQINEILFNVEVDEAFLNKNLIPVIFLHGFTGSSLEWKFILEKLNKKFLSVAVDLIGHGDTSSPENPELYGSESQAQQLNKIFTALSFKKVILCGYSLGGRAALSYYANYADKTAGLILESSTPGIEEVQLRSERIKSDELLAKKIKEEGVEKFGSYWLNLPMFDSLKLLPQEEYQNILKRKINNNPTGLINSLISFGTGSMPNLWQKIEEINLPVLLISGEYDDKFCSINERMNLKIRNSQHKILKNCGHNVHLEKPEEFCNLVNRYLSDNIF